MSKGTNYVAVQHQDKIEQLDTIALEDDEDDFLVSARRMQWRGYLFDFNFCESALARKDRFRRVIFGLQWAYLLISVRLLVASWITYTLLGRYFVMLPFAFESLLCVCCASVFFFKVHLTIIKFTSSLKMCLVGELHFTMPGLYLMH